VRRKISAHVDRGLSGGSRVRRPGSKDPHWREKTFLLSLFSNLSFICTFNFNLTDITFLQVSHIMTNHSFIIFMNYIISLVLGKQQILTARALPVCSGRGKDLLRMVRLLKR
jgi:hypothetical protein